MFRKMRRYKQELDKEECLRILKTERRGTLAVIGDDGYPYAVPINFCFDETDGSIYFHSALEGHKTDSIKSCDKVCFTVYDSGERVEGDWAAYVRSVIVFGRATTVNDVGKKFEKARKFGMKYFPSEDELDSVMNKHLDRMQMIEIEIEHMTGKLVHEK